MKAAERELNDRQPQPLKALPDKLTLVGIGASAGGLKALQRFFETLPADSGMAFVVITHLAPDQESLLPELLQRYTDMPVSQVQSYRAVESNHVYVIPPGQRLLMTDTHVDVEPFEEPRGRRTPVDDFFRSLAAAHGTAVAVVLSGGGTDGSVGVKAIKEKNGLLLVQHPDEAEFDGMPEAAIATGLADLVLPVTELAQKLLAFHQNGLKLPLNPAQLSEWDRSQMHRILTQVQIQTGHDLSQYQPATLLQRIYRRIRLFSFQSLEDYLGYLRNNPDEAHTLFNDLLVGVTTFFRSPESWQALAEQVVPRLFEGKQRRERIRVWSVGCATGEEAYSLAILLLEEAARREPEPVVGAFPREASLRIQIFASDLDEQALQRARLGRYPEVIEADLSPERLERFFEKEGAYYRIRPELRDMVLFASHSVLYDPPFSRLDLISSRNLLTHLQQPLRRSVLEIFYYALNPGCYLFLDRLDALEISPDLFQTLDPANHIYATQSRSGEEAVIPALPLVAPLETALPADRAQHQAAHFWPAALLEAAAEHHHQQALEALAPPSLLIDEDYQVLHLSESAGRYLRPRRGPVVADVRQLVRPKLQAELEQALALAFQRGTAVFTRPVTLAFDGSDHEVVVAVRPYRNEVESDVVYQGALLALLFFLEAEGRPAERPTRPRPPAVGVPRRAGQREQQEMGRLHAQLQATIERYETNNDELRVANEKLRTINDAYQAAVEELETSQEEIRSVNEELRNTNYELERKVTEISLAHNDMENLMAATAIPTLFLDRQLHIRHNTPAVARLLGLQPHDRGRSLTDLAVPLNYPDLVDDARRVLDSLRPVEKEIEHRKGKWLLVHHHPYRAPGDVINGVVITLVDITRQKQTEMALRAAESNLEQQVQERTAQVRQLASELIASEQTVRQRIAQSLHDDLQQTLYASKVQIQFLREEFGEKAELKTMEKTISHALDLTRKVTLELSPPVLEEEGLTEGLNWLAKHMRELYGLRVEVKSNDHPDTATKEQRVLVYQIVRELLFNVVKHAGVQEAEVGLQESDEGLTVLVSDYGRGFDVTEKTAEANASFGLRSIHERLQLFDGRADIESKPGAGTRVRLFLPHRRAAE